MLKMPNGGPAVVDKPPMAPHHCALVPQVHTDPDGFVDTGTNLPGFEPRVYLSMIGIRELIKALGWPTPEDVEALREEFDLERQARTAVEAENARLREELAAVEVLKAAGYSAQRARATKPKAAA